MSTICDFLVIGGGIIGLNVAIAIKTRHPDNSVILIDKEPHLGAHASGRNSGVLHAGFYYDASSLKARFSRDGNKAMKDYCESRGLSINRCGKLVVARDDNELNVLMELYRRGQANQVEVQLVDEKQAAEIEPRAKVYQQAIFSPTTASVNPREVVESLTRDAFALGITILTDTRYAGHKGNTVTTSQGSITAGYIINTAGLYADRIAMGFGFSKSHRILPFKGLYIYSDEPVGALRTNIYPVPDLRNPFLGVHFTLTVDGHIKIGPTATPAFWREHYQGLTNFNAEEMFEIVMRDLGLMLSNDFGFRKLAVHELMKSFKPVMVSQAAQLARGVEISNYQRWAPPGIRAQLFDIKKRRLETDFKYEGDNRSFHVLNAVSPAFTCSIPFAAHLVDEVERLAGRG
ncbi:MAG: L-2-hydroxyglutarate oxidase [Chromatiales bacterium]|nr:L-2-hydroxyglutarate oxidase [Chromatiales bacterium]